MARKRNVLWTAIGLGFAMAIGPLVVFRALQSDPDAIKAELAGKTAEIDALPVEEALRRDALAEELLAVQEYRLHARSQWLKLERLHPTLHEAAKAERSAIQAAPPVLARCKDPVKLPRAELQALYDEVRALLDNYGATRFGASLRDAEQRLRAAIDAATVPVWNHFLTLSRTAQKTANEGRFTAANGLVEEFRKKVSGDASLEAQLEELRSMLRRKAKSAADSILARAREHAAAGRKAEAIQLVDRGLPDYQGLPEAASLEAYRRSITPR